MFISAATTEKVVGCAAVAGIAKFVGSTSKNPLPRLDVKSMLHVTVDASATGTPTHTQRRVTRTENSLASPRKRPFAASARAVSIILPSQHCKPALQAAISAGWNWLRSANHVQLALFELVQDAIFQRPA